MFKNLVFSISLLIPGLAHAGVQPISHPSPNSGTITPAAITVQGSTFTVATTGQVGISTPVAGMNGNLRVRAGTGNGGGTTPIVLYASSSSSSTWNTDDTAMIAAGKYTLPANTLVNNGDYIEVFCVATATTTNLSKAVESSIAGIQTANGATTATDTKWSAESVISRTSATTANIFSRRNRSSSFVTDSALAQSVTFANDNEVTCDIRASSTADPSDEADANMTLRHMSVILYPAP